MDPIQMYDTMGPVRTNGQWNVQLTATSSKEDADKFNKLFEQMQSAKTSKTDSKPKETAKDSKEAAKPQEKDAPREDPQDQVKRMAEEGNVPVEQVLPGMDLNIVRLDAEDGQLISPLAGEGQAAVLTLGEVPEIPVDTEDPALPEQNGEAELLPEEALTRTAETPVQTAQVDTQPEQVQEKVPELQNAGEETEHEEQGGVKAEVTDHETAPRPVFHNVQSAPIKVGEAPAAEQTGEADVAGQIDAQLAQAMANGQSKVEIQLTPENLGTVKIEIVQTQDGALHIALSAENSQTRGLLEKHAVNLQAMMASRSQQDVHVEVQHQEESQRQQQNPYEGRNGQQGQQQQEQQHRRHPQSSQDFLQQLRLGLIPSDGETL